HRPAAFAGILDHAFEPGELRIGRQRACGQVEQPRTDHAAAPPYFSDVGEVQIEARVLGQSLAVSVLQNIETFGKGLHQSVFDAVMDHLDEMAGAARPAMQVTELHARVAAIATERARHIAEPRRQRLEYWIEAVDDGFGPANHHAVAALQAPDAAPGADIDVMNAAAFEHCGAPDVVFPKRIAAVDYNVIRRKQPGELDNRVFGDLARGQHDPDCARRTQFVDERVQPLGANRAIAADSGDSIGVVIVDHRPVTVLNQAARDVAAHASETDHANLHMIISITLMHVRTPPPALSALPRSRL